ncbi:hypothetical protein BC828DRAFT_373581 [Blastocladiella britannica]|nr:hypothetical protein BC828DRAFT_373581 [Blastocladiella britannica]
MISSLRSAVGARPMLLTRARSLLPRVLLRSNSLTASETASAPIEPASTPVEASPKPHSIATASARILQFQSQLPRSLYSRLADAADGGLASTDGPIKILVIADRQVGRAALVNALLGYPDGRQVVNEEWGVQVDDVIRITKGDAWSSETIDGVQQVQAPAPALAGVEWTLVPPLTSNWPHLASHLVAKNDLVLFVTDTPRHLTTSHEATVAAHLRATHHPTVIAINGVDYLIHEASELPRIVAAVRERVGSDIPVFPVSSRRAAVAAYLSPEAIATGSSVTAGSSLGASDNGSGVSALAQQLYRASHDHRGTTRARAVLSACDAALDHLTMQHDRAEQRLRALAHHLDVHVTRRVVGETDRLVSEFHDRDIKAIDASTSQIATAARDFFRKTPAWSLLWRADDVAGELRAAVRSHALSEAEIRMAVAAGRLGEGLRYVYEDVARAVKGMYAALDAQQSALPLAAAAPADGSSNTSIASSNDIPVDAFELGGPLPGRSLTLPQVNEPLPAAATDPAIAPVLVVLDRLHQLAARDSTSVAQVDPFALSNVVWRYRAQVAGQAVAAGTDADLVRTSAETLALRAGAASVSIWLAAMVAVVQGGVDVGAAALVATASTAGVADLMRRGWKRVEDDYIQGIAGVQEGLRTELTDEYHKLVRDKLTVPLSDLVELYDQSMVEQLEYLVAQRAKVAAIKADVRALRQELTF